jgi:DNA replication licensing factor MCM5
MVRLRGDINVLLLGDPSGQGVSFSVYFKVAPVGIYTSGKGSSAAGLTASVVLMPRENLFGRRCYGSGGRIVCIDELTRCDQPIAWRRGNGTTDNQYRQGRNHDGAQLTISVFAAANPVFGRYDDFKSASENIDLNDYHSESV